MAADDLLHWRSEFPILANSVYLVSHSLGAMPRRTRDRLAEYADTWATRGVRAWGEGWWELPRTVGDLIGRIIGAGPGEVVMHQNQSIAQATVLSAMDWRGPRNGIVTERLNFTSNLYLFHALERDGARLVTVQSDDGLTVPLDRLLAAIDETTRLVSVSHVVFKSAFVQDIAAIIRRAHDVGALVLVDLYQSVGTVPIDVRAVGADFATGGSVKWLCGGPGAGYLYVRREHWENTPAAPHRMDGAPGAVRVRGPPDRLRRGRVPVPERESQCAGTVRGAIRLRDRARDRRGRPFEPNQCDRRNVWCPSPMRQGSSVAGPRDVAHRGGTVTLDVPSGYAVASALAARDVLIDYRPGAGIRVSPHFYTSDEELDTFMANSHAPWRPSPHEKPAATPSALPTSGMLALAVSRIRASSV